MKTPRPFNRRFALLVLAAAAVAAPLVLTAPSASARDFRVGAAGRAIAITRTPAYANGWGWGYPVYNTTTTAPATDTQQPLVPSLPDGWIATLPSDAAPVVVFGQTYYFSSGFYYQPTTYLGQKVFKPANP